MKDAFKLILRRELRETSTQLADLNREMATKLLELSSQTGDVYPLIDAVKSLHAATELYSTTSTPIEHGKLQKAIGDTLFKLGKAENNREALEHAAIAYRGAITVASMLDDQKLRRATKSKYASIQILLGEYEEVKSVISVA